MRNISEKMCRETQNSLFYFQHFLIDKSSVYEIMWENIV